MNIVLDEIDRQILDALQQNARMPLKEIAGLVHMSSPAVSSRISRLEEAGVIMSYRAQLNPTAIGMNIKAFINLEVAPTEKKDFYPYIEKCSNVIECNCVTGDYSMIIEVLFESTAKLDVFIGELQKFGRTKTLIVFSTSVEHRGVRLDESSFL